MFSNQDINWTPNKEYIFIFESQDLSDFADIIYPLGCPKFNFGITLKAQIIVQVLKDYTLRVKMNHIQFHKPAGPTTIQTALMILASKETTSGTSNHEFDVFQNFLEEPLMISVKREKFRKVTVSKDEPEVVTKIKASLVADLQDISSSLRLRHLKNQPISSILQIPSQVKQIDT